MLTRSDVEKHRWRGGWRSHVYIANKRRCCPEVGLAGRIGLPVVRGIYDFTLVQINLLGLRDAE